MEWRCANEEDLDLLADWNKQLIVDEGHRNSMTVPELRERMANWLTGEYIAIIFLQNHETVAYGLYREDTTEIYLRQFFVSRPLRRGGIGRMALNLLRDQVWSRDKRLTVGVLTSNDAAVRFWRAVGYSDYCLTLEIDLE